MSTLKQLEKDLELIVQALNDNAQESNKQTLGFEALTIIEKILKVTPFEINARILRMQLNTDWVFDNSSEVLKDAEFIVANDAFKKDRMIGYDWLTWVYNEQMALPDKAIEIIEEQLVELHALEEKHYDRDRNESELLSKIGFIKLNNDQKEGALHFFQKSFEKYPYLHERNAIAGMLLLEEKKWKEANGFLKKHFEWCFETEDDYRLQYGLKLKELYDKNELDTQPDLIALLFHVIRNEEDAFGLVNNLDFLNKYIPELEKWVEKYPKNSMMWSAIGNTYYFDSKNYEKSLYGYKKMLEGDNPTQNASLNRILKSAKKMDADFFALPFKFTGTSQALYNHMTDVPDGKKKKKQKLYAELAFKYGEASYNQYKGYLIDKNQDTSSNQPHLFAMCCNNYGLALYRYNKLFNKKEDKIKFAAYYANIHIEGYEMSPFMENLDNGAEAYFEAEDYQKAIHYYELYIERYHGDVTLFDIQNAYWYIIFSHAALGELNKVKETYEKSKAIYLKMGSGVRDATKKFIFIAKKYFLFSVDEKKNYEKIIPEVQWFLEQRSFTEIASEEVGLMHYYLGICYKETNESDKAIAAFQKCINQLEDEEVGYYYDKSEEAVEFIKALGGKPKGDHGKKKGLLGRLWK